TLGDHFRYSPSHGTEQESGFIIDPSGGFSIGNAFLSSGRNALINGIAATLTDHYGEHSSLTFRANQTFTHLSSSLGGITSNNLPTDKAMTFPSGATGRHQYTTSSSKGLEYTYRLQNESGTSKGEFQRHSAVIGGTNKFNRSQGMSPSIGPAWSIYDKSEEQG